MRTNQLLKIGGIAILSTLVMVTGVACKTVKVPKGVQVVDNFKVKKYLGKWYEIARFDFKYQKDLKNVSANYSLNDDGSIKVENKGYNYVKNKWVDVTGKAKFVGDENKGALKVSFFGPFYSGYNVVAMDPDYENVLVFGETKDNIWILSRNKTISHEVKDKFLAIAREAGYDLKRLIWTQQD